MPDHSTTITECPDCGADVHYKASFMPPPFNGHRSDAHLPHLQGSQECLERQVRNLKAEIVVEVANEVANQLEAAGFTLADGKPSKYLIHLRFAGCSAVIIDTDPDAAVRRAQLYEPDGGWEHAFVETIARVRPTWASRVLAMDKLNKRGSEIGE